MKKLDLRNSAYKEILARFEQHLKTLNYSKGTVYNSTNSAKEYLYYLEQHNFDVLGTTYEQITSYFTYLSRRANLRRGGGLSASTLNKHKHALNQFFNYLVCSDYELKKPILPCFDEVRKIPTVLSLKEVGQLFNACGDTLLGKRNKAILALYYGLGLRRKEGVCLKLEDVDFDKEEVFVAQSKTHRQRRVPMSEHVKEVLEDYVFNAREKLVPSDKSVSSFLTTERGKSISGETVVYNLKQILKQSEIKTPASVHTLRHSIATHLLQSGMKLESIALFLGHKSLDSTQIYTHITPTNTKNNAYENDI